MTDDARPAVKPNPRTPLSLDEIEAQLAPGWALLDGKLRARYRTGDFATGLAFVNRIGSSAERWDHHPDIELTYGEVAVTLSSHDVDAITSRDIRLAGLIADHAAEMSLAS